MEAINFKQNYGGKLFNDWFSTVRLHDPEKFINGNSLEVYLRKYNMGIAQIVAVRTFYFHQIRDVLAQIECGNNASYLATILQSIYGQHVRLEKEDKLDHVVLRYTRRNIEMQAALMNDWWKEKVGQQENSSTYKQTLFQ